MLKLQQRVQGVITAIDAHGRGILPYGKDRIFVPAALPDEQVEVTIVKMIKEGYIGAITRLTHPSQDRVEPPCPHAHSCGGCQLMHMAPAAQLRWKQQRIIAAAKKEKLSLRIHDVVPSPAAACRNKVIASFGKDRNGAITAGLYEESSHRIVAIDRCLLHPASCDAIIQTIRMLMKELRIEPFDVRKRQGFLRHVQLRWGVRSGEILVTLVASESRFPARKRFVQALLQAHPAIRSIVLNVNRRDTSIVLGSEQHILYGSGWICDELLGRQFHISSSSFYQINHDQCERLYQKAYDLLELKKSDRLLDAYCGIGTIGLCAASQVKEVIGVELNAQAIADARINAKRNKITNARFICEDASRFLLAAANQHQRYDAVLLDPPREGSTPMFLDACARLQPARIAYISCNPLTQLRDLKILAQYGYVCDELFLYDMFPMSTHTESVALLKKGGQRTTKVRRGSVARTQKDRGAHEKRYRHGK